MTYTKQKQKFFFTVATEVFEAPKTLEASETHEVIKAFYSEHDTE